MQSRKFHPPISAAAQTALEWIKCDAWCQRWESARGRLLPAAFEAASVWEGHDVHDRARGMRSARRSDVLWTNPRLPRPGRTAGSSGSVCTAAQPLTQNRALRKWLNIFAARRPGNNRTFSWFGRNPSGGLPGRRLGSRCTVTKVGKSDREGAFAGASGNDEDAPMD